MGAKNRVIAGDYAGKGVTNSAGAVQIILDWKNFIPLKKYNMDSCEVITQETQKSAASGIARGAVGAALLGPVGLLAGVSAKSKGVYTVAVRFKDGKNSLLEMDNKLYKILIKEMF